MVRKLPVKKKKKTTYLLQLIFGTYGQQKGLAQAAWGQKWLRQN